MNNLLPITLLTMSIIALCTTLITLQELEVLSKWGKRLLLFCIGINTLCLIANIYIAIFL